MKLHELLQGIEVLEQNADPELELTGVSYDSRSTAPGELFAAISGYATDGHRFIPAALARGAACVLCEHDMPEHTPWVRVRDARAALAQLGCNWFGHPAERLCMIGVTGTNGKTTVTCLVKHVLEQTLGAKVGLIGTIENRIGDTVVPTERTTPESFALQGLLRQMLDAGCTHVVMEVSSHALALHRVDGIPFTVGAFTNLTEDHLDFHKTMEAYGAAKARLFRLCRTGVLNADDPAYRTMLQGATCTPLLVGTGKDAALRAEQVQLAPDHVAMGVREGEKAAHVRVGIPGRFTVSNALLTLGIARALGIGLEDACRALGTAAGVKGRIEVVPTPGRDYTVLIDYAHTPDGLENILRSVRDFCRGRLIVLFGCGGDRDRTKRPIMGEIAARLANVLVVTSDNPRTEEPMAIIREILAGIPQTEKPVYVEENRRRAIRMTLRFAQKDDMIVLAGKGHETYQVLGTEKIHFDEREEVAACLQEEDHEQ